MKTPFLKRAFFLLIASLQDDVIAMTRNEEEAISTNHST